MRLRFVERSRATHPVTCTRQGKTNSSNRRSSKCAGVVSWPSLNARHVLGSIGSMRRCTTRRLFATTLLFMLVLPDFMAMSAAQATTGDHRETMLMTGEPCAGHGSAPAADPTDSSSSSKQHAPVNDGTCCKASTCPCLHAPALISALQIQCVVIVSYADGPVVLIRRPSGHEPVSFRPPI
jgi:hypothetical protein